MAKVREKPLRMIGLVGHGDDKCVLPPNPSPPVFNPPPVPAITHADMERLTGIRGVDADGEIDTPAMEAYCLQKGWTLIRDREDGIVTMEEMYSRIRWMMPRDEVEMMMRKDPISRYYIPLYSDEIKEAATGLAVAEAGYSPGDRPSRFARVLEKYPLVVAVVGVGIILLVFKLIPSMVLP